MSAGVKVPLYVTAVYMVPHTVVLDHDSRREVNEGFHIA